jgi:hypothetical protein
MSRNYSLIPLLLFLTAVFYTRQKEKPLIYAVLVSLMANTHVLMCWFCTMLAAFFGYEQIVKDTPKKVMICSFLLMFFSIAFLFIYIISAPEKNVSVQEYLTNFHTTVPPMFSYFMLKLYGSNSIIFNSVVWLLVFVLSIFMFTEDKKLFTIFLSSFLYQMYIYIHVWITSFEKAFLFLLSIVFCFWIILNKETISQKKKNAINILIIILFGMSLKFGCTLVLSDIHSDFSGSKRTAEFISKNIDKDAVIVSYNPMVTAGISAYLPDRKFYSPQYKDFYTLCDFHSTGWYSDINFDFENLFKNKKIYFLGPITMNGEIISKLQSKEYIFASPKSLMSEEQFFIFRY